MDYQEISPIAFESVKTAALPTDPAISNHLGMEGHCREHTSLQQFDVPSQPQLSNAKRWVPTSEEWRTFKPLIKRLYIEENKPFSYVQAALQREHRFFPT